MSMMPKSFVDSVVTISIQTTGTNKHILGTGFLVGKLVSQNDTEKNYAVFLVTNKHVIKNQQTVFVGFNQLGGVGYYDFQLMLVAGNRKQYSSHPNKDVDIVAFSLNAKFLDDSGARYSFFALDEDAFTIEQMKSNGVYEGDLTYQLGYPLNLAGTSSKNPICRFGCISRISDMYIPGHPELSYLVDSQSFPGNSGGPVVLRPESVTLEGGMPHLKSVLIGILHSYVPYRDPLISQQTGEVYSFMQENSGLTNVHPVNQIIEVVEIEYTRVGSTTLSKRIIKKWGAIWKRNFLYY